MSEKSRKAVEKAIEELNYRPNVIARSLVSSQSNTIGVCVPFLNTPFFASMIEGIETEAENQGYDIFISHTKNSVEQERKAVTRLLERRVDGLIIIPVDNDGKGLEKALGNTPYVLLMREPINMSGYNSVRVDDYRGSRTVIECLLEQGHRKIGFIKDNSKISTTKDRWTAVTDVYNERGLHLDEKYIFSSTLNFDESFEAARKLLDSSNDITAVYTLHYWGCAGLLREAGIRGIKIPDDLSVSSFDAFDDWNTILPMKITSNIYPSMEIGVSGVNLLSKSISEKRDSSALKTRTVILTPKFRLGESTREI